MTNNMMSRHKEPVYSVAFSPCDDDNGNDNDGDDDYDSGDQHDEQAQGAGV